MNDRKWVCVSEDFSTKNVFAGYGAVEFAAKSKAKQACQAKLTGTCSSSITCDELEVNSTAWFCETKNYITGGIFNGVGASKVEAAFNARKECYIGSGSSSSNCASLGASD